MGSPTVRVYLAGRLGIEVDERLIDQQAFPGQQGRLAFAFLVCERARPVARSELANILWPGDVPSAYEAGLNAVVSKLRALLGRAGLSAVETLTNAAGCYELRLPANAWVDLEAAVDAIHDAEAALKANDPAAAYGPSAIAHHIARRPFLAGDEGPWVEARRQRLHKLLIRALECRAEVYLWNNEHSLAVEAAGEVVALEPFRESGYRLLMRAHAAAGNVAEALWTYERCRKLIAEELGVDPSPETKAVHLSLLQSV